MKNVTWAALVRPRLTLALWATLIVGLSVFGLGMERRLTEGFFLLSGTESGRAADIDRRGFGDNEPVPVLLRGQPGQLDRQGPRFVARVRTRYTALSPWDPGERSQPLRPSPESALVLVSLTYDEDDHTQDRLAPLREMVDTHVRDPVRAHISGKNVAAGASTDAVIEAATAAQTIAIPMLLLVLLLVFRSPIAAAIPATVGVATVAASAGVINLVTRFYDLAGTAVQMTAMMGLALGVDYSLLIVSRFREELAADEDVDPRTAAATAAATAGRTVLFAGAVLVVAMALAVVLSPGSILVSVATGVVIAVGLSLLAGAVAVPAALTLVGRRMDRWRIGSPGVQSPLLSRIARTAVARPVPVVTLALLALLALGAPALALDTGPPNLLQLPEGDEAREDFAVIDRVLGPGQASPFQIAVHSRAGPIATPSRLAAIERFERGLSEERGTVSVAGPGALASAAANREGRGAGTARDRAERDVLRHQVPMFVSERGRGDTARIFLVPRDLAAAPGNRRLRERLELRAAAFQERTGMEAAVGGLAGEYVDYNREVSEYIPLLVVCVSVLTFLLLVVILRALVLPAVAILLNLAIVAASFGALKLLFQGADPLLGGPGFVDVISIAAIFVILFALSVDYEVFLLTRMHEAYVADADPEAAIFHGIGKTAAVVTGAALIMMAVFISFGVSGYATARQFGVGLSVAVALDALVLRLLLLPATMRLLGRWSWWLPAWLDRRLPRLDVEGSALRSGAPAA